MDKNIAQSYPLRYGERYFYPFSEAAAEIVPQIRLFVSELALIILLLIFISFENLAFAKPATRCTELLLTQAEKSGILATELTSHLAAKITTVPEFLYLRQVANLRVPSSGAILLQQVT